MSKDINIATVLRMFVRDEVHGIYTASTCIVEEVDEEERRVEVSLKTNDSVIIDNVPIATPFASDASGAIFPVHKEDEGLILHTKQPLEKQLQSEGPVEVNSERRFTLESAVYIAGLWLDDTEIPEHEEGEFMIAMPEDGPVLTMTPDGSYTVEHPGGGFLEVDEEGVHVEPELFINGDPYTEHTHNFDYDGGGENSSDQSGTTEEPQ